MNYFFRLRFLFFSLLLSALALSAQAQSEISGHVYDESGEPLPYVNVLLLTAADSSLVKGSVTDTTGVYQLNNIADGRYRLSAQMVGFRSYFSEPFTPANLPADFSAIRLSEATTELGEVVVSSTKPMIEVTSNAIVLNVASSPILKNGTAQEVLEKSPGVVVDQNGNISVKGKTNVLIYLDGKPTYLSNTELIRLLESTPAENIEKLEIMDNPPAKYDAEGNAGIINIVRKEQAAQGLNGNIGLTLGYGRYPKASPSLNLNYRQGKINLFGNYSYYYSQRYQNTNLYRRIPSAEGITTFDQFSDRLNWVRNNNFRAGADWFLTERSTLGVLVNGNRGNWNSTGENLTQLGGVYDNPYDGLTANNRNSNDWNNLTYNLNFKHQWENESELTLDADYSQWKGDSYQHNNNFYFSNEGTTNEPPLLVHTFTDSDIDILALQADYSRKIFGDWGLEAGVKSSSVTTDNVLDFQTQVEGEFVSDPQRSNQFQYEEDIKAIYANLSKKWGDRWQLQAGLRGEHTYSQGHSVTIDSLVERDYFNLFPSASVSYAYNDQHQFSASYSRRIDRPNYSNLNPFEFFLDRFTFERGNPFLNPQYTNSYGLTYGYQKSVFLTLNYTHTTDAISQVLEQDEANQTTYQTTVNLNQIKNYSANLAAPLPVADWWMLNLNLTGFYNDVQSPFSEGGEIDKSRFSYNARAQNTFSLPGDVKFELSGFYSSPTIWGLFEIGEQYQVDAGVSKSLGKFSIQASCDDIFNIRKNNVIIQQGDIDTIVRNKWESRVFRLNLSYRFGNEKIKQARRRGTASDELRERTGGSN
uniref:TonB-dependent receptor n=1 Tax=Roseihalotalea indica TaxID=2867963 RepID=A0AA49GS29_9BACT|nr:TonB-dependent receptor [Tunicatimonas sp. TK19036]